MEDFSSEMEASRQRKEMRERLKRIYNELLENGELDELHAEIDKYLARRKRIKKIMRVAIFFGTLILVAAIAFGIGIYQSRKTTREAIAAINKLSDDFANTDYTLSDEAIASKSTNDKQEDDVDNARQELKNAQMLFKNEKYEKAIASLTPILSKIDTSSTAEQKLNKCEMAMVIALSYHELKQVEKAIQVLETAGVEAILEERKNDGKAPSIAGEAVQLLNDLKKLN